MTHIEEKYKSICDKLGFIPSEYQPDIRDTEYDGEENPFLKLSTEELDFLLTSGYLNKK